MADEQNTPEVPTDTPPGPQATQPADTGVPATPSAADASAETDKPEDGDGEQPKPKARGGFQKRIGELTAKTRELERQLAEARASQGNGTASADAPKRENFANYDDYVEAKATFAAEQAFERKQRENAEGAVVKAKTERLTAFQSEMAAEAAADPAFAKAWQTASSDGFPISPAMGDFIAESDDPRSLIEWLSSNRAEAAKLYHADFGQVSRALARVEAGLVARTSARTPQAPPPPPTVGGRSTPRVDLAKLASTNTEEYIARRREQMAKAR